jgi:hypothetical protein
LFRQPRLCGTGKAVNTGDEDFIFTRCHRGYGGVAILWSKCIDPLVKVFKEGNSRIQRVEKLHVREDDLFDIGC